MSTNLWKHRYVYVLLAAYFSGSMIFFMDRIWASPKIDHFSDLYPRWYGTKELLLHHRDPYGPDVTHEVQIWAYGRVIDSDDIQRQDQDRFVYPLYLVFLLAPLVGLSFQQVQGIMHVFLPLLILGTILLWMRAIRWRTDLPWMVVIGLLSLTNFPMLESIYLQQPGIFAAAFLAGACAALVSGRMLLCGVLLACSTIKPQLSLLLVLWIIVWSLAAWKQRRVVVVSFAVTLFALIFFSELLIRGWPYEFMQALIAYQRYNGTSSILNLLLGKLWATVAAAMVLIVIGAIASRARHELPDSELFSYTCCAVLASTVVLMPTVYPTAQIILLPVIFLIINHAGRIWSQGATRRLLLFALFSSLAWPWIGASVLFILHFVVPIEHLRHAWILVLGPIVSVPFLSLIVLLCCKLSPAGSVLRTCMQWRTLRLTLL